MSHFTSDKCGAEVRSDAQACPQCGYRSDYVKGKSSLMSVIVITFVFVFAVVALNVAAIPGPM